MRPGLKLAIPVALAALAIGGCSFRVVLPPPPPSDWPTVPRRGSPEARCTSSPLPPAADTGVALLLGGLAFVERNAQSQIAPIILAAASIPVLASAIYGYIVTTECRHY